jgi:Protein of unknown function (DUF3223)
MASLEIGGTAFRTKGDARTFFKGMLGRYQPGDRVSEEDARMLRALIERHPERDQKVDVGITGFHVDWATMGTKCFWLTRTDGTKTDFSYTSCIRGAPPSLRSQAISALRRVVDRDIAIAKRRKFDELKDEEGKVVCATTGEALTWEGVHADHQQPMTFEVICTTFAALKNIGLEDLPITDGADNQLTPTLTDLEMAKAFREYHHKVAKIRIVSKQRNLLEAAKHRLRKKAATREAQLKLE